MDLSPLRPAAFIAPNAGNPDWIAETLHQATAMLLGLMQSADKRPPLPVADFDPHWVAIPDQPQQADELIAGLGQMVLGSMNAANPRYVGHMDTMPALMSLVGDLAAAAVNNNMLSVEMSPVFSRLEDGLLREIAHRFELGHNSGGVMASGGSVANLHALTVARNHVLGVQQTGLWGQPRQPVILTSEVAHTSIQKAAMLLGLGTQGVISVRTDAEGRMDPDDLRGQIRKARANGQRPIAVVATVGTTVTGSIDPLPTIADISEAEDVWLHVDAAYGGALIFAEPYRHLLAGIEHADSITFNPQKWLYVAKTCAMALFKDMRLLTDHFRVGAPYMREQGDLHNRGELGVQGTRHADVLKLWLVLNHLGTAGISHLIAESYRLTAYYVARVAELPYLRPQHTPAMNLITVRGEPDWIDPAGWDEWNAGLQAYLLNAADFFLSLPRYRGVLCLRAVLLNPYTDTDTLDALFAAIRTYADQSRVS